MGVGRRAPDPRLTVASHPALHERHTRGPLDEAESKKSKPVSEVRRTETQLARGKLARFRIHTK